MSHVTCHKMKFHLSFLITPTLIPLFPNLVDAHFPELVDKQRRLKLRSFMRKAKTKTKRTYSNLETVNNSFTVGGWTQKADT